MLLRVEAVVVDTVNKGGGVFSIEIALFDFERCTGDNMLCTSGKVTQDATFAFVVGQRGIKEFTGTVNHYANTFCFPVDVAGITFGN